MDKDEALKLALRALENGKRVRNAEGGTEYQPELEHKAITAIQQALAAPAQERVQWIFENRAGEKYTPKYERYTKQEAAVSAMLLGHKSIGPSWLNQDTTPQAQPSPVQEPVNAWQIFDKYGKPLFIQQDDASAKRYKEAGHRVERLAYYTTPSAAQRQPLTGAQIIAAWELSVNTADPTGGQLPFVFARALEAVRGIAEVKT